MGLLTNILTHLLSAFGGAAVALAAAAALGRLWIKHQLEKELESYKAGLTQKTEVLKTELSIFAHEQNVGLERIDAQRSDAILTIWALLGEWQEHFIALTAPNERLEQNPQNAVGHYERHAKELMREADKLSVEVRNRAIFFDQGVYESIARCGIAISEVTIEFFKSSFESFTPRTDEEVGQHLPVVQQARKALHAAAGKSVNDLRQALLREFRHLMKSEKER